MYLGKVVELADVVELYAHPRHPYTVALLSAIPEPDPRIRKRRVILHGDIPSPARPPSGCHFHTRCWLYEQLGKPERCVAEDPPVRDIGGEHRVACHFAEQVTDRVATEAVQGVVAPGAPEPPAVVAEA
jgi:peptide/nickel transport system ATP-binding protein